MNSRDKKIATNGSTAFDRGFGWRGWFSGWVICVMFMVSTNANGQQNQNPPVRVPSAPSVGSKAVMRPTNYQSRAVGERRIPYSVPPLRSIPPVPMLTPEQAKAQETPTRNSPNNAVAFNAKTGKTNQVAMTTNRVQQAVGRGGGFGGLDQRQSSKTSADRGGGSEVLPTGKAP